MILRKVLLSLVIFLALFGCVASKKQLYDNQFQLPPQYSKNHDWVGERIIFLKRHQDLQKYGYQGFCYNDDVCRSISYSSLAGKTAEIIGYKAGRYPTPPKVILKLDGSNFIIYTSAYSDNINNIGFVTELDNAKKYIGKTVWNKGNPVELNNVSRNDHIKSSRELSKFEKMHVVNVEWDIFDSTPLKFTFRTEDNSIATWSGGYSGKNKTSPFDENWYFEDPKTIYSNWTAKAWESIEKSTIFVGMTKEQALLSWGEPKERNKSVGSWGTHEQWVYETQYLYFENGILSSFQSSR